jgi:hypothetical protein
MADKSIRFDDPEAAKMLSIIALNQKRSEGNQVAWLIRQEYARIYSRPNELVTVEEAEATIETPQAAG